MDNVNYKKEFYQDDNKNFKIEVYEPEYDYNKSHMFNVGLAQRFGINEAIILENLMYWIEHNKANNKNCYDGYYWTYNSIAAFHKILPYLSEKQIRHALNKLEKENIIKTGNYNKMAYDKTKWYAIIDKTLCTFWQIDCDNMANRIDTEGEPIPLINTINNTINNIEIPKQQKELKKEQLEKDIQQIYQVYPGRDLFQSYSTGKCKKNREQIKQLLKQHSKDHIIRIIQEYLSERKKAKLSIKTFGNFLSEFPEVEEYDIENMSVEEIEKLVQEGKL